jgi:hypothetical protein
MFLDSKFAIFVFECWVPLRSMPGGVDGNLHVPVPSMDRLNQTKPAAFYNIAVIGFS